MFAGSQLARAGKATGRVAGLALGPIGATFDVASLASGDERGISDAQALAQQFAATGMSYDQIMKEVQNDPGLESAIGDIGASDRAKTIAGSLFQVGDLMAGPAGLITGAIGIAAQSDLQNKKRKRSEAFKEELNRIYGGGM